MTPTLRSFRGRWRRPTLTLYKKLFFLLIVSVYIPVFSLGLFSYNRYGQQLEKAAEAFLSDNLQNNARRIDEWFDDVERRSVDIYSSDALQKLLAAANNGKPQEVDFLYELSKIRYALAGPYDLSIYPADLNKISGYSSLLAGMPKTGGDWFERALQSDGRGFWMYEAVKEFGVQRTDFYYVRPIRALSSFDNLGVMVIRATGAMLQERMVRSERYARYNLTVVDADGNNLLAPDSAPGPDYFSRMAAPDGSGRMQTVTIGGTRYYADSRPIRYNDWRLAAVIPVSDVQGPIKSIQQYTWLALIASLAVITVLLAIITRGVTVPIRTVVKYMKKVRQSVLERCLPYSRRRDEIGQLVGGYNAMIGGMLDLLESTKQAEREKRKLELQMLMHQINPHFLYNTLDSIKWKAESAQQAGIAEMATSLADLLRFSLNEGEEMTTLERELEHVKSYVNIEQLRKGGFRIMFHVQPGILNAPFLKLIVQPIVENAIRHGMDRLPDADGKLLVSVYREERDIVCVIEDNGPGCTTEELVQLNRMLADNHTAGLPERSGAGRGGLGLRNVHRRLAVSFGDGYGVRLEPSSSAGLRVVIRHPLLENTP